jgi:hypothetical protein
VRGFFREWRIALRVSAANFSGRAQFRGDFFTALEMGVAWQASVFVFAAVLLFAVAVARVHLAWSPGNVLYLAAAVIGGALIEGAVQTLVSIVT